MTKEYLNVEGDTLKIEELPSGDFALSFENEEEGYAGATVIPKEFICEREHAAVKGFVDKVKLRWPNIVYSGNTFSERLYEMLDKILATYQKEGE